MKLNLNNPNFYIIAGIVAAVAFIIFMIFAFGGGCQSFKPTVKTSIAKVGLTEEALFPHLSKDNQTLYYFGDQGIKVKKIDLKTGETSIAYPNDLYYTLKTSWSSDDTKILIKDSNPNKDNSFYILDLTEQKIINLDTSITNAVVSPDGSKLYYQFKEEGGDKNYLASSDLNGKSEEKLADLEFDFYAFMFLNNGQDLGFWSVPGDTGATKLESINLTDKKVKDIISTFSFTEGIVSPDGQYIAYGYLKENATFATLSIIKSDGTGAKNYQTPFLAKQAAWSKDGKYLFLADNELKKSSFVYRYESPEFKEFKLNFALPSTEFLKVDQILAGDNNTIYVLSNDQIYVLTIS